MVHNCAFLYSAIFPRASKTKSQRRRHLARISNISIVAFWDSAPSMLTLSETKRRLRRRTVWRKHRRDATRCDEMRRVAHENRNCAKNNDTICNLQICKPLVNSGPTKFWSWITYQHWFQQAKIPNHATLPSKARVHLKSNGLFNKKKLIFTCTSTSTRTYSGTHTFTFANFSYLLYVILYVWFLRFTSFVVKGTRTPDFW